MEFINLKDVGLIKAGRYLRPDVGDVHHEAYTRVRRGKFEAIPQKGAVLKERGEFMPKGPKEAKEILGGEYKKFITDVKNYFAASDEANELKEKIGKLVEAEEASMLKIRPLLQKFDNVSKKEHSFEFEFMDEGFKHRFLSWKKTTSPYKDLFEEAFKRLTPALQKEVSGLKEKLEKVTAQESFKREKIEKSDSWQQIADHLKEIIRLKEEFVRNMKVQSARLNKSLDEVGYVILEKAGKKGMKWKHHYAPIEFETINDIKTHYQAEEGTGIKYKRDGDILHVYKPKRDFSGYVDWPEIATYILTKKSELEKAGDLEPIHHMKLEEQPNNEETEQRWEGIQRDRILQKQKRDRINKLKLVQGNIVTKRQYDNSLYL